MCDPFIVFLRKMGFFILKIMIGVMVFCLAELPGYATSDATSISTSVTPKSKRLVCYGNSQPTTYDAPPPYTSDNSNIQLTGEYWCTEPGTVSCNPNTIPIGVITSTITTYGILVASDVA